MIEIAELLGVTRQRASTIVDERGFPKPIGREGQSRFWDRREVTAWAKAWRRAKPFCGTDRDSRTRRAVGTPDPRPPRSG